MFMVPLKTSIHIHYLQNAKAPDEKIIQDKQS